MVQQLPKRPILMSSTMVRPTRARTKTETRRTTGLSDINAEPDTWIFDGFKGPDEIGRLVAVFRDINDHHVFCECPCPYGQPGTTLIVRESWAVDAGYNGVKPRNIPVGNQVKRWYLADGDMPDWCGYKRQSIHLPTGFSRLHLALHTLKVDRLWNITEQDAKAEGMLRGAVFNNGRILDFRMDPDGTFLDGFRYIWYTLNGADALKSNPWVWVLKYSLIFDRSL